MARFLFVVPPLVGHVNPTVSVAAELSARGHEVAWVAHPTEVRPLLPEGARLFPLEEGIAPEDAERAAREARAARGLVALKLLWEGFFLPLARAMLPGVEAAARSFGAGVLVVDQQALAGGVVARKLGLPWATSATTAAGVTDPLETALPQVHAWLRERQGALAEQAGLPPLDPPDLSPHLVLVFSTEALAGPSRAFPPHVRFVGPALRRREERTPFPWEALAEGRRVLVSLGTVPSEGAARFFSVLRSAFASPTDPQAIVVAPEGALTDPPPRVLARPFVPQLALLPHLSAVVCHAGQNTVAEALEHGKPLVVLPIKYDQSVIAEQVVSAGAGLRLKFGRVRPDELREAVRRVLDEPAFAEAAARVRASFEAAGGAARAAALLEGLA